MTSDSVDIKDKDPGQDTINRVLKNLKSSSESFVEFIYFCRLRPVSVHQTSAFSLKLSKSYFDLEQSLKIKITRNRLQLQLFGGIGCGLNQIVSQFEMDFNHFLENKFLKKSLKRVLRSQKEEQTGGRMQEMVEEMGLGEEADFDERVEGLKGGIMEEEEEEEEHPEESRSLEYVKMKYIIILIEI